MKNFTLLMASFFLVGSVAKASESTNFLDVNLVSNKVLDFEPIMFVERGIAFYVFPNGQFDFNTEPSRGEFYFRNGRRNVNNTFGAPANNFYGGVRIEHDSFGRIRRVGNVFINYDFQDRIKRIGTVYMAYNQFALAQVGGLRLIYNRFGELVDTIGSVKRFNNFNGFDPVCLPNNNGNPNNDYYANPNYGNNPNYNNGGTYQNPNDNYYYRKEGRSAKVEEKQNNESDVQRTDSGRR
jgi:hypothetical protein